MINSRKYTRGENLANSLTHLLGVFLSIYGIAVLEANSKTAAQSTATGIFGATLFLMFLSSVIYHSAENEKIMKFFQKIDHSAIYILIAGTYTPGLVFTVKFPLSVIMLCIIWALAIIGILFTCISLKPKHLSTSLYLLMGWISLIFFNNVWTTSHLAIWLLLSGGVFYSIGCVFYLTKFRYTHFIWHLFVIAGATMHYFAILELLKIINKS